MYTTMHLIDIKETYYSCFYSIIRIDGSNNNGILCKGTVNQNARQISNKHIVYS